MIDQAQAAFRSAEESAEPKTPPKTIAPQMQTVPNPKEHSQPQP
jgi:hypothetical protein